MEIRQLNNSELHDALPLVWKVFCEYEAVNYSEDGKQMFYDAIHSDEYLDTLQAFGAFDDDRLVGISALRNDGSHVALFFVDGEYHNHGIGKALWNEMLAASEADVITVHSSAYALEVYKKLGFIQTGDIQDENGIQFIPMQYNHLIDLLQDKDDKKAYAKMQDVITVSSFSNKYYALIDDIAGLLGSEKTYIRTRAFLICAAQARWDEQDKIKEHLPALFELFHDKKSIVVRQCLNAAKEIVHYKPELKDEIEAELQKIDLSKYNESMTPLLKKDIENLQMACSLAIL